MPGLVRSKSGSRAPPWKPDKIARSCGRQAVAAPGQRFLLSATVADRQWQRPDSGFRYRPQWPTGSGSARTVVFPVGHGGHTGSGSAFCCRPLWRRQAVAPPGQRFLLWPWHRPAAVTPATVADREWLIVRASCWAVPLCVYVAALLCPCMSAVRDLSTIFHCGPTPLSARVADIEDLA